MIASLAPEGALEVHDLGVGARPLLGGRKALHPLHQHAPVPGAVEHGHATPPGKRRPEAPEEVVALLVRRGRRELGHMHVARIELLDQALERSALPRGVPALEHHRPAAVRCPVVAGELAAQREPQLEQPLAAPRSSRYFASSFESVSVRSSSSRRPSAQPARALRPRPGQLVQPALGLVRVARWAGRSERESTPASRTRWSARGSGLAANSRTGMRLAAGLLGPAAEGRRSARPAPRADHPVGHPLVAVAPPPGRAPRRSSRPPAPADAACCTGLGHAQIGSKSTCLPWYSASSSVQIAFIASTRSRMIPKRVPGSVPWLRISSRFQPAPTPNRTGGRPRSGRAWRPPWP